MAVEIELFGQLARDHEPRQTLTMASPMQVQEVILLLGLEIDQIGLISINGVQSELHDSVPMDCRLCFFPPMSGG